MFDSHKKELEKLGYKVYTNKVTGPKGDIVASINPYGSLDTKEAAILKVLSTPVVVEKVEEEAPVKKKVFKKK